MSASAVFQTDIDGLKLVSRGKVRDIYDLGQSLLIIATDRLSAFDVVFPTPIPHKGQVLTQMTLHWLGELKDIIPNHLISADTDGIIAAAAQAGAKDAAAHRDALSGRSMLVRKAQTVPIECVVRGYISGSLWKDYVASGSGCVRGMNLGTGLKESDKLPQPIFTPSTKAAEGHDENISTEQAASIVGAEIANRLEQASLALYTRGSEIAAERDIIIADTKFEFGMVDGEPTLIDEVLTPDSSRFWDRKAWQPGSAQESFDKQYVRDWLEARNWDKKPPAPQLPADVVEGTTSRYLEAYRRITGKELPRE